ncbi:hypothetical protein K3495_g13962, partial [Podosphaera aphanis]
TQESQKYEDPGAGSSGSSHFGSSGGYLDSSGDTIMGGINTAGLAKGERRRAKWKNQAQLDRLRREGKCFRCERVGCSSKICPLLPASNPAKAGLRVNLATLPEIDPSVVESGEGERPMEDVPRDCDKEVSLNTEPFLVNALLNDIYMVQALIDNGCLCSGIIDDDLTNRLKLPRINITPRALETAENSSSNKPVVTHITYLSLDLDGLYLPKVWFYVVPSSTHKMILGKKWLEDQDAVIHSRDQRLELRKTKKNIYSIQMWRQNLRKVARPRYTSTEDLALMSENVPIGKVTIEDISKALREKPKLSEEKARELLPEQVKEFAHLFADTGGANDLPASRGSLDHEINLRHENGKPMSPPWGPLYSMSREELLVLRKTLTELLQKGWIRPSSSPAAAPVLFARKPNGGLRFCVDYRGLNAITVPDRYPIPLFRETLRQLSKATWFTKLDVKSAFHRLRIRKGDEWLTAFRCRLGLFEWLVTPFGLINAPASFQRYINEQLREHLDLNATVYMDDVLIYTNGSRDNHWEIVRAILTKLDKAGLYLDIEKCNFLCKEVKYLGFIVRAGDSITVDPSKVKAILEWKPPTSASGIRSFLGFANFYRCFVEKFSDIAAPLINLTKKKSTWKWGEEENKAFEKLKAIFASEPVLAHWDPDRETIVEADCSGYAMGGCLSQRDKFGRLRPIAYLSKRLNSAEVNYPIHDKEMLAIVACLKEWKTELNSVDKPFTILTDHKNLNYFATKRLLSERQVRYNDVLQQFRFELKWRAGSASDRPDALSRRDQDKPKDLSDDRLAGRTIQLLPSISVNPTEVSSSSENNDGRVEQVVQARIFEEDELQNLWEQAVAVDKEWQRARDAVKSGERSFPPDIAQKLKANIAECSVAADGVLRGRENRIWVPDYEPLRTTIMQRTHDSHLSGHPGRDSMVGILLRRWFWPKMRESVRRFIRNCDVCGRSTVWREAKAGFLRSLPIPERIGSELTIDFIT